MSTKPTQAERQKAAQAWCKPTTSHKVMDPELAEAFAEILHEFQHGVSLRDWFAGHTLLGSVYEDDRAEETGKDGKTFAQISAWRAYLFADAMIQARESNSSANAKSNDIQQ